MKKIFYSVSFLLFIILICIHYTFSQQSAVLDINNVKARVWNDGDLFWDKEGNPAFEYPAGSGKHATSLSGLWITGQDIIGFGTGAATFKRANPMVFSDFYPGPLDMNCGELVDSSTMATYNRVWKVYRHEIELFKLCNCIDPTSPLCDGYTVPASIKEWPGNPIMEADGDHLQMEQQLAPYFDYNGDGVYDWTNCDIPNIRGDMAIFWVMNDQGGPHTVSNLLSMGVEIRCMAYASNCDNAVQDMIFVDYDIIPRCGIPVSDMYIGMYSEAEAGNGNDDRVGTNVEKGYIYHYNADANDSIYGNTPAAMATVLLRGPRMNDNGVDDAISIGSIAALTDTTTASGAYGVNGYGFNDGGIDNEFLGYTRTLAFTDNGTLWGNPITGTHFYRYMRGYWKDGSRMIYGGWGYPTGPVGSAPVANYAFPGASDPMSVGVKGASTTFNWSETDPGTGNPMPASQRKFIATTGPINPATNEHIKLTYAFIAATGSGTDSLGLELLAEKVDTARALRPIFFDEYAYNGNSYAPNVLCFYSAMGLGMEEENSLGVSIYPNPGSGNVFVQLMNAVQADMVRVIDLSGRVVQVVQPNQGGEVIRLDLSSVSQGIYIIEVQAGKQWTRKKYIKNR